jgi:signal transduction histidine kinase
MSSDRTRRPADGTATGSATPAGADPTSDLAALLAHELETPLAIIQTAVSLALELEPSEEEERRRLLGVVRRNSDLASLLLRRLGTARDLEMGTVRLDRRSSGYLLDIDPDQVDYHRFRHLVDRARDPQTGDREAAQPAPAHAQGGYVSTGAESLDRSAARGTGTGGR